MSVLCLTFDCDFYVSFGLFLYFVVVLPVTSPPGEGTQQRPDGGQDSDASVGPGYFSSTGRFFSFLFFSFLFFSFLFFSFLPFPSLCSLFDFLFGVFICFFALVLSPYIFAFLVFALVL